VFMHACAHTAGTGPPHAAAAACVRLGLLQLLLLLLHVGDLLLVHAAPHIYDMSPWPLTHALSILQYSNPGPNLPTPLPKP
jgi:hypothetical protein